MHDALAQAGVELLVGDRLVAVGAAAGGGFEPRLHRKQVADGDIAHPRIDIRGNPVAQQFDHAAPLDAGQRRMVDGQRAVQARLDQHPAG